MDPQDTFGDLPLPPQDSEPITPRMAHTAMPENAVQPITDVQSQKVKGATNGLSPPPSSQPAASQRNKTRTPTPAVFHISTPPPTVLATMTPDDLAVASASTLREQVQVLQTSLREAKMSAAHHELQYKMLQQETSAKLERMAVEARMTQHENDVIHHASEKRRADATHMQAPTLPKGVIPVHKDLYQRMTAEIQGLRDANQRWERECSALERVVSRQEGEIASLSDKVTLMRERIKENREQTIRVRSNTTTGGRLDSTPRSLYSTPHRSQGLEALLQASEMTNQDSGGHKKGHSRNTHSMSSLPTTPQRGHKSAAMLGTYQTPSHRRPSLKIPSTAPMPRTSAMRAPAAANVHGNQALAVPGLRGPPSEGTVSASDHDEEGGDSEAETDILDPDLQGVHESQASLVAPQLLRDSQDSISAKRESFMGSGMLGSGSGSSSGQRSGENDMKQTRLFGAVRKAGIERVIADADDGLPASKKQRTDVQGLQDGRVGLGISGVRD